MFGDVFGGYFRGSGFYWYLIVEVRDVVDILYGIG